MAVQPEISTFIGPPRSSRSRYRKASRTGRSAINDDVDTFRDRTAAVNEQSGERISGRREFSEAAAVWPDPSPLDDWWKSVMWGCDGPGAAVPPAARERR